MNKLLVAFAIGSAAIGGGAAVAQDGPPPQHARGGMGLMRADTDGDGVITRAEYQAVVDARFQRLDANGNGKIDEGEGRFGRRTLRDQPTTPPSGTNGTQAPPPRPNGTVGMNRDQLRGVAMTRFDRVDTNHDGRIDRAELSAAAQMRRDGTPAPAVIAKPQ